VWWLTYLADDFEYENDPNHLLRWVTLIVALISFCGFFVEFFVGGKVFDDKKANYFK